MQCNIYTVEYKYELNFITAKYQANTRKETASIVLIMQHPKHINTHKRMSLLTDTNATKLRTNNIQYSNPQQITTEQRDKLWFSNLHCSCRYDHAHKAITVNINPLTG